MSAPVDIASNHFDRQYDELRQQIIRSLERAEAQKNRLQSVDHRYSIFNIVLGAVAAFIAGQSLVAAKPVVGDWRMMTTVSSVLTLGATVATGLQKKIASPEAIAEVNQCVAHLKALKVETLTPTFELQKVADQYKHILTAFSQVDC